MSHGWGTVTSPRADEEIWRRQFPSSADDPAESEPVDDGGDWRSFFPRWRAEHPQPPRRTF